MDQPEEILTPYEEAGVKAILGLQASAKRVETRAQAIQGWRAMSKGDRRFTLSFWQDMEKELRAYLRGNTLPADQQARIQAILDAAK